MPAEALENAGRLGVVLDELIEEFGLDALALRCWIEMQQQLKVSPCVLLSEMNDRGIAAACEVDVGNAVAMHALAPGLRPAGDLPRLEQQLRRRARQVHPLPLRAGAAEPDGRRRGRSADHAILANALERGCALRLQRRPHRPDGT